MSKWDYIVVGAGSAGCAVVNRLSESGKNRVLVVEAGGSDKSLAIKVPAGLGVYRKAMADLDWNYHSEPDPTRNGKSEAWVRGRVVGGGSSVNGMLYVRGAAYDYDRWAAMGNKGWSAEEVLPLFKAMESSDQDWGGRGKKGPLQVRTVNSCHPVTESFLAACRTTGIPYNADYNGEIQDGAAYAQCNQSKWFRCSAADAFLKPALRRQNVTLITHAVVHKILIEKGCAKGIRFEHKGRILEKSARNVVVCAGAINSPKLLMLSGIGDPAELSKHGIPVVVDRPAVGKNLIEHPEIYITYKMKVPTNSPTEGVLQKAGFLMRYLFKGEGPLSNLWEAVVFLRSSIEEPVPDIQLVFTPWSEDYKTGSIEKVDATEKIKFCHRGVSFILNKSRPLSSGEVRLASADPKENPLIECRFFSHEDDIRTLVDGVKTLRGIMTSSPIAEKVDYEVSPGQNIANDDALASYVRENALINAHPIGTCRMGIDNEAVVTPELKVRGVENLWIGDASIMPDHISGNINAACMMIGEKLGRTLIAK